MVKSYWERRQDAKAALLAAREAVDALEKQLDHYWEALTRDTSNRTYLRLEAERHLRNVKGRALLEAAEVTRHVADAVAAWWPDEPEAA